MSKRIKNLTRVLIVTLLVQPVFFSLNRLNREVYAQEVTKVEEITASSDVESIKNEDEAAKESSQQQKDAETSVLETSEKEQPSEQEGKVIDSELKEEAVDTNTVKEVEEKADAEVKEEGTAEDKQPALPEDVVSRDAEKEADTDNGEEAVDSQVKEEASETVKSNDIEKENIEEKELTDEQLNEEAETAEKTVVKLQLDKEIYTLEKDTAARMLVTVVYSDESKEDVTKAVKYTSSDKTVAKIDTVGKIAAVSTGEAQIIVEYQGAVIKALVKVREAEEKKLEAPKSILTFSTQDKIYLKWDEVEAGASYDIEINSKLHTNVTIPQYTVDNLKPNTQYSIRIRSKKQEAVSEWSSDVKIKTLEKKPISFIEYTIDLKENEVVDIIITASGIKEIKNRSFTLYYDPEKLEVEDLSTATEQKDINTGKISGTDIEVKEYTKGTIKLTMNKEVADNEVWSGVVNTIKLRSKISGKSEIKYVVK